MLNIGNRRQGYSLLGLLLTLAIASLVATLAIPGWSRLVAATQLRVESNAFLHGIHMARRESVKRNAFVSLCKSRDFISCDAAASWGEGWMIFVDSAESWPPRRVPADEIIYIRKPPHTIDIIANRVAFSIRTLNKRTTNGTIAFCDRYARAAPLGLVVSYTGRPRQRPLSALRTSVSCGPDDR